MNPFALGAAGLILVVTLIASLAAFAKPALLDRGLFRPYWFVRRRQYATFITSGFLHADLAHLLFNLITFYFFGLQLERDIGTMWFVVLYFAGMAVSHWGTWYKQRNNPEYSCVGASGAISAVLFAEILFHPEQSLYLMFIPVPIPAPLFAIAYLAYTWYASRNARGRINHDAHLGGAITGLVFVALVAPWAYGEFWRALF